MCRSMVHIQSATAEIRPGIEKKRKMETTGQKYNVRTASAKQGGHSYLTTEFRAGVCRAGRCVVVVRVTEWRPIGTRVSLARMMIRLRAAVASSLSDQPASPTPDI